jgi:hypothetical protein
VDADFQARIDHFVEPGERELAFRRFATVPAGLTSSPPGAELREVVVRLRRIKPLAIEDFEAHRERRCIDFVCPQRLEFADRFQLEVERFVAAGRGVGGGTVEPTLPDGRSRRDATPVSHHGSSGDFRHRVPAFAPHVSR